jgi:hypothetical protein
MCNDAWMVQWLYWGIMIAAILVLVFDCNNDDSAWAFKRCDQKFERLSESFLKQI